MGSSCSIGCSVDDLKVYSNELDKLTKGKPETATSEHRRAAMLKAHAELSAERRAFAESMQAKGVVIGPPKKIAKPITRADQIASAEAISKAYDDKHLAQSTAKAKSALPIAKTEALQSLVWHDSMKGAVSSIAYALAGLRRLKHKFTNRMAKPDAVINNTNYYGKNVRGKKPAGAITIMSKFGRTGRKDLTTDDIFSAIVNGEINGIMVQSTGEATMLELANVKAGDLITVYNKDDNNQHYKVTLVVTSIDPYGSGQKHNADMVSQLTGLAHRTVSSRLKNNSGLVVSFIVNEDPNYGTTQTMPFSATKKSTSKVYKDAKNKEYANKDALLLAELDGQLSSALDMYEEIENASIETDRKETLIRRAADNIRKLTKSIEGIKTRNGDIQEQTESGVTAGVVMDSKRNRIVGPTPRTTKQADKENAAREREQGNNAISKDSKEEFDKFTEQIDKLNNLVDYDGILSKIDKAVFSFIGAVNTGNNIDKTGFTEDQTMEAMGRYAVYVDDGMKKSDAAYQALLDTEIDRLKSLPTTEELTDTIEKLENAKDLDKDTETKEKSVAEEVKAEKQAQTKPKEKYVPDEDIPFSQTLDEEAVVAADKHITDNDKRYSRGQVAHAIKSMLNAAFGTDRDTDADAVTEDQAIELASKTWGPDSEVVARLKEGTVDGLAFPVRNKDGKYLIYVNHRLNPNLAVEVIAHEVGHVIKFNHVDNASKAEIKELLNAYSEWLANHGVDGATIEDFAFSKMSHNMAVRFLKSAGNRETLSDIDPTERKRLTNMSEWFADQAGKALLTRVKRAQGGDTVVHKFFYDLTDALVRLFGGDKTGHFIDKLAGKSSITNTDRFKAMQKTITRINRSPTAKTVRKLSKQVFYDKDSLLRASKIPAMNKLADLLHKRRGDKRSDNSYWTARGQRIGLFTTELNRIMETVSKEDQAQMMQDIYSGEPSNNPKVTELRTLVDQINSYARESGIPIGIDTHSFPQVVEIEAIMENEYEFIQMLSQPKYRQNLEDILDKWSKGGLVDIDPKRDGATTVDDMPRILYDYLIHSGGVDIGQVADINKPSSHFTDQDTFNFFTEEDLVEWNSTYLSQSPMDSVSQYINQMTKLVEYEKRFGRIDDDTVANVINSKIAEYTKRNGVRPSAPQISAMKKLAYQTTKLDMLVKEAESQGATREEISNMYDSVSAEMGVLGKGTAQWLNSKLGIPMPRGRSPINSALQTAQSVIMTGTNMWILGLSTLTSLSDPLGIAARTGDFKLAYNSMKAGVSSVLSKDPDSAKILAEQLGIMSNEVIQDSLRNEYAGAYMSRGLKKFNDAYFKAIQLESWTRTTRMMAVHAAQAYIKKHKDGGRELEELNIKPSDLHWNTDGSIRILTYDDLQSPSISNERKAADARVRRAITEFVDGSILRPNPSQRPLWASDPHFALLFHLKSFMYSFHKTILNPVYRESTKFNNHTPLMALASYIPVSVAITMLKDVVKGIPGGGNWKSEWGPIDYMWDAAQNSGITGIFQPIFDGIREQEFGGSFAMGFLPPEFTPGDTFSHLPVPFNYWAKHIFGG